MPSSLIQPVPDDDETCVPVAPEFIARCFETLKNSLNPLPVTIERYLVTRSDRWGLIFRADCSDENGFMGRFVCVPLGSGAYLGNFRDADWGGFASKTSSPKPHEPSS